MASFPVFMLQPRLFSSQADDKSTRGCCLLLAKRQKMMNYVYCFLVILLLGACRPEAPTPPSTRWALPTVRYLENSRELRGQLLLFAGDSLPLADPLRYPGQVSFLGSGMKEVLLPGPDRSADRYRYEATLRTDYPTEFRFSFPAIDSADAERRLLPLRMPAPRIDLLPDTIRRDADLRFGLASDSLRESESLILFFTGQIDGAVRRVRVAGPTRSNRVRIPPAALQQIEPGPYRLYLVKSRQIDTHSEGLRTAGLIEYYTREKEVVVE